MESTALRYFREVVKSGSVRRAAETLHIAPSAISRQITHLEYRLKAQLFERQTNKLILTEEGRIVAAYAETVEADVHRLLVSIDDVSTFRRGHVRIATVEAMVARIVPMALARLQTQHPNLTASVDVLGTSGVLDAVARDHADIGIAFCPEARDDVERRGSFPQPMHLVVAPFNPLASATLVPLAHLGEFRVALPYESFGIRRLIESVASKRPLTLLRVMETNSIEMVKGLVRNSNAITFLPKSAVLQDIEHGVLKAIPMSDPELAGTTIEVLALKHRALSKAADAFLRSLESVAGLELE